MSIKCLGRPFIFLAPSPLAVSSLALRDSNLARETSQLQSGRISSVTELLLRVL